MRSDLGAAPFTAVEASRALADGNVSAEALVEDSLTRIGALDGRLRSFVHLRGDEARLDARAADTELKAGRRRSPLHGIPFALKDIYDVAGIATTAHSRLLLDHVSSADSTVAARLAASGAILIGKLALHEFATGGPALDLPFPPARNPWSTAHFTGGSSSGSGAAVAAGLVPLAMGSDTSGSIRGPAGYCGIAGFKPTYGVVSRKGVIPLSYSLDHCGPMAWTTDDCALMLDAIAGHDPADPGSAERQAVDFYAALEGGVSGMRIGVVRHFFERDIEADPETLQAIENALAVLQRLGATLVPVTLPPHQEWDACCRVILYSEAFAIHERDLMERPQQYAAITRARLFAGQVVSAAEYVQATRWRRALCRRYAAAMDGLDALATGGTLAPAPRIDELLKPPFFTWHYRMAMAPFSVVGAPALSVCSGFSRDGLPLSLQFAGRPFEDATVLRLGHAYEQATPWRQRRPPL